MTELIQISPTDARMQNASNYYWVIIIIWILENKNIIFKHASNHLIMPLMLEIIIGSNSNEENNSIFK